MPGAYVSGEDKLRADLRGMAAAAHDLEHVLGLQSRRVAEQIADVPRGSTGRLQRGIVSARNRRVTRSSFEIGPGEFYGHMVFRGTEHSAPQPPTIPGDVGRETARRVGDYIVRHRHGLA
jgi:hypothetical protein